LTPAEGRRFACAVGGAFMAIAALMWWRGRPGAATTLAALGITLALAGLAIPTRLGPIEQGWMALARIISTVTTPIVMGIMYFLVITPIGILRRLLGGNPLVHAPTGQSFWKPRPPGRRQSSMRRQF
jgi:hypothetical protein